MFRVLGWLKNTIFLFSLVAILLTTSIGLALKTVALGATVATMTASSAAAAIKHRKDIAKAVSKTKAKERLKRTLVAVPTIGTVVALSFEANEYKNWQAENPDKTKGDYGCEVANSTSEVLDEVLQEMPERLRPSPALITGLMPDCDA